jgi:NAD(P)-dependent dehydrogenase (short-subunit alcohol dehydrogenase family)
MGTVVVTGSTKGIGRGLVEQFIAKGHNTVICSRSQTEVDQAVAELNAAHPGRCSGIACDVSVKAQVQAVWDLAVKDFGQVDYWVNNAGRATSRHAVHELPEELTRTIITSNLLGTTFGSQVAITGFRAQGIGNLYNVLGGSFDGKRLVPNMGVYSATKAGIYLLTQYLVRENKDQNIVIGMISPGMLITANWFEEQAELGDEEWRKIRPLLNILCDDVDTVMPWLADEILANTESGKRIAWMRTGKMLKRFVDAKLLRRERDLFTKYGL